MSAYTSSDDIAVAFARVYGAIVDQVEVLSNELPNPQPVSRPPRGRGPLVAIAAAMAVIIGVGGVALIQEDPPVTEEGPVQRIALLEPPGELGAPVTLVSADVTPIPPVDMPPPLVAWRWEAVADPARAMVLIEADPDPAVSEFLGLTVDGGKSLLPPANEDVTTFESDFGWVGRSWLAGDSWWIALGPDETAVAALVDELADQDPSAVDLAGFEFTEGPRSFSPDGPVQMVGMEYQAPTGSIHLGLMTGASFFNALLRIQVPGAEPTEVNGAEAVIADINEAEESELEFGPSTMLAWQIDESSSAFVWSDTLEPDVIRAIAEAVEPVSTERWDVIVADVAPSVIGEVENLQPQSDQVAIESGQDWAVVAQTFMTGEDSDFPGELGLCGWLVLEATGELADLGCAGAPRPFGQVTPFQAEVGDGLLITAAARADVAEVRIEAANPDDEVTAQIQVIDPAVPFGWWAVLVPADVSYTQVTYWDNQGNQLPGGGRLKADERLQRD